MTVKVTLLQGDSLKLMPERATPRNKADACITDPPYGFDFDSYGWDTFKANQSLSTSSDHAEQFAQFTKEWVRAATEMLWPGAHILAFGADRTFDLVGRGLRLANIEIVRSVFWLYATGQVIHSKNDIRPGGEPIIVGRYMGRMGDVKNLNKLFADTGRGQFHAQSLKEADAVEYPDRAAKHPTNVMIDSDLVDNYAEVRAIIDQYPGTFFVPKPSPKDRDWGCADLEAKKKHNHLSTLKVRCETCKKVYKEKITACECGSTDLTRFGSDSLKQNIHPTVKPIELMRRLIKMTTRPGHTVIDPFMGSGTTGIAAVLEGRNFIGFEREPEYFTIAKTRIGSALAEVGGDAPITEAA